MQSNPIEPPRSKARVSLSLRRKHFENESVKEHFVKDLGQSHWAILGIHTIVASLLLVAMPKARRMKTLGEHQMKLDNHWVREENAETPWITSQGPCWSAGGLVPELVPHIQPLSTTWVGGTTTSTPSRS